jgi:hypothetical protein
MTERALTPRTGYATASKGRSLLVRLGKGREKNKIILRHLQRHNLVKGTR